MSLDLPQLVPQLGAAAQNAAEQEAERHARLPQAERALEATADLEPGALEMRLQHAGEHWHGAVPTKEPVDAAFPAPDPPHHFCALGADGSQIYPDRHASALFYLINIGSICIEYGSGDPPAVSSRPSLHYLAEDLYDEHGALVTSDQIDGQRDLAEMAELARLARHAGSVPSMALLDNGLLPWSLLQDQDHSRPRLQQIRDEYIGHLSSLHQAGSAVAGVIDRPRQGDVLALAYLGGRPASSGDPAAGGDAPHIGLTDPMMFRRRLAIGERSALFVHGSPANTQFQASGHQIRFFYLRSSADTVLRVEVPAWVTDDQLDLVHAGLLHDSSTCGGFPYSLVRAHELAVVSQPERTELAAMIETIILRYGLSPRRSMKSTTKRWLTGRRRHRIGRH
jgi:hypothetical protein